MRDVVWAGRTTAGEESRTPVIAGGRWKLQEVSLCRRVGRNYVARNSSCRFHSTESKPLPTTRYPGINHNNIINVYDIYGQIKEMEPTRLTKQNSRVLWEQIGLVVKTLEFHLEVQGSSSSQLST